MKKSNASIIGTVLIVLGLLSFPSGVLYTLTLPKIYSSTSTMGLEFSEPTARQYTEDALIALTRQKAELVKIRDILDPIVTEQNLTEKWGREDAPIAHDIAYKILSGCINSVADDKAAGIIRITVLRDDPAEAAVLANAISSRYQAAQDGISILENATPGVRPVSPRLFLNLLISLIQAVVLIGTGVVTLFVGKKKRARIRP